MRPVNCVHPSLAASLSVTVLCLVTVPAFATEKDVEALIESSCIACHDASTDTPLNIAELGKDLSEPETFRQWERIYDRVERGEMPPEEEPRPDATTARNALASLKNKLTDVNLAEQQANGRVRTRRLTNLEFEYTLRDLFGIHGVLARHLPPENESASFDTIADGQGISPVHIRSYLRAADAALDEAIQLGRRPRSTPHGMNYRTHFYTQMWLGRPLRRGGNTVKAIDDALVFFDGRPHLSQSDNMGYRPPHPGMYRIHAEAYAYQAKTPVTMLVYRSSAEQGGAELIAAFDLPPGNSRIVDFTSYFTPQDFFYIGLSDDDWQADGKSIFADGAKVYTGEGVAVKWLTIRGPLVRQWPSASTRRVLPGVEYSRKPTGDYEIQLSEKSLTHITGIVKQLAPQIFRRPVADTEVQAFVRLAEPAIREGGPFEQAVRIPLRAMLSSPQFLFHSGEAGLLDDYSLATRLAGFLWKSLPDQELFELARHGELSKLDTLARQVDRMLEDTKSNRFVNDFLNQWLKLKDIDATTPDAKLYPEYDDVLRQAMLAETRHFFRELIDANLSADNLIESRFTFLNRRLAEHYGIALPAGDGLPGEKMRRTILPNDSVRGGLLTQASILKVTANGTVTTPIKRGSFVLASILGTPPDRPAFSVEAIEPDTRGTTTIRETLDAHRNVAACASCHNQIDPPGFALESFDPIGGHRTKYRSTEKGDRTERRLFGRSIWEYREGLPVDPSGVTAQGESFDGIRGFKRHLMKDREQVARNLVCQLVAYATGGEIQFADREEVSRILDETRENNFPVRTIIHQVVQSRLFRNK